jgi:ABC-type enterobactin transport system permease subunit
MDMDRFLVVILTLGVVALVCLGGVIYLAAQSLGVPDVLVATTGAAVGALGSILVRSSDST